MINDTITATNSNEFFSDKLDKYDLLVSFKVEKDSILRFTYAVLGKIDSYDR